MNRQRTHWFSAVCSLFLLAGSALLLAQNQGAGAPTAQQILDQARTALGGDALSSLRSLTASGRVFVTAEDFDSWGELRLDLLLPDKFMKTSVMKPAPSVEIKQVEVVSGEEVWTDVELPEGARGGPGGPGGSGGPVRIIVGGPPGGAPPAGGPSGGGAVVIGGAPGGGGRRVAMGGRGRGGAEQELRRDLVCLLTVLLAASPAAYPVEMEYDGQGEYDGSAVDVLRMKRPDGFSARLMIDQATHRPVLITYLSQRPPAMMFRRREGQQPSDAPPPPPAPLPPPEPVEVKVSFSDYKVVSDKQIGEVWLPHRILKEGEGIPTNEWRFQKFTLNPDLKPGLFEKKAKK
jgi:hypothetical protein